MVDRDPLNPHSATLLDWLTRARARLRVERTLRDASWAASGLLGLFVAYRLLALLAAPAVAAALLPLLGLCAVALLALLAWRLSRPLTLAQAAGAADRRGALHDEIKSAYWFAGERVASPVIELVLRHAVRTVGRLEPARLFPLPFPRGLAVAFGLGAAAVALAWVSPRAPERAVAQPGVATSRVASATGTGRDEARGERGAEASRGDARTAARVAQQAQSWARLQQVARSVEGPEGEALRAAVAARDAQSAIQALAAAAKTEAGAPDGAAAGRAPGRQVSEAFAQSIIERLKSLLDADAPQEAEDSEPTSLASSEAAARIAPRAGQPEGDTGAGSPGRHTLREDSLNMQLRSIARTSTSQGQAVAGRGEGWQEGGRTNASTGAMGQRVGVSSAGAGDDNPAQGNPEGEAPADPVLGKPTVRLAAQLQHAAAGPAGEQAEQDGAAPSLYAATRAQAATLTYRSVDASTPGSSEQAIAREHTPLQYRGAVKHYFLMQHRKEP